MAHEATLHGIGVGVGVWPGGTGPPAVLLEARGEIIPIFVDAGQAQTIERARQRMPAERPLTHDLFADVLDDVDARLDRVRIDDLADGTYYAKLDLTVARGEDRRQIVRDARPSDGIALAVRVDCPITIADAVIDEAGQTPDQLSPESAEFGVGGSAEAGMNVGSGDDPADIETSEERESIDLDEAVDIDIKETEDADADDDPES